MPPDSEDSIGDSALGRAHPHSAYPEPILPPQHLTRPETIVVVDFGGQYCMLIARRIRECNVFCEIVPPDAPWEDVRRLEPKGFVLSGGPASVYDIGAPSVPAYIYESGLPVLGICYGMQAIAHDLGGDVKPSPGREYGHATLQSSGERSALLSGLPEELTVWMSHGDKVLKPPTGFRARHAPRTLPSQQCRMTLAL